MFHYTLISTSFNTAFAIFTGDGVLCWLSLHPSNSDPTKVKLDILKDLKPNQRNDLFHLKEPFDLKKFPVDKIIKAIENPREMFEYQIRLDYRQFSPNMSDITYEVWSFLQNKTEIGKTTTYGKIAIELGVPNSSRAVARACASNKISVFIPCHRVLTKDGGYSGYRWGIDLKKELLKREGVLLPI